MNIRESIIQEVYATLPYGRVASIIEKHHQTKITDTLVEKYVEFASERGFTFDPVVFEIRKLNKFDNNLVEGKIEFILEDNSTIVITEETFHHMREVLEDNHEAIEFMRYSKDNFQKIFEIINIQKDL